MRSVMLILLISVILVDSSYAYIGPGLGLGAVGALVGTIVAIFLAIIGVIWYPLKRLLRKVRSAKHDTGGSSERQ
jgi:O-antigen/teichoic acid export membrane protein